MKKRKFPTFAFLERIFAIALVILVPLLNSTNTLAVAAPLTISNLSPLVVTEQDPPAIVDSDITFTNGLAYSDGFVRFTLSDSTSGDQFALSSAADPNAVGAISVTGVDVYLGNGTDRDRIGSIDATENGQNGQPLKILFASPLENYSFEDGMTGWSTYTQEFSASSQDYSQNLSGASIPYYYGGGSETGKPRPDIPMVQPRKC